MTSSVQAFVRAAGVPSGPDLDNRAAIWYAAARSEKGAAMRQIMRVVPVLAVGLAIMVPRGARAEEA